MIPAFPDLSLKAKSRPRVKTQEHTDRTHEPSMAPRTAYTVPSELHTVAVDSGVFIRRTNVLVHDSEMSCDSRIQPINSVVL